MTRNLGVFFRALEFILESCRWYILIFLKSHVIFKYYYNTTLDIYLDFSVAM
jgi:hypothetical protein